MKYFYVVVSLLLLNACTLSPTDPFTLAEDAIEKAKQAQAASCAPKLLSMAEYSLDRANEYSSLYGTAYARTEQRHGAHQASSFVAQAERYAKQAEQQSLHGCNEETTVILLPDTDGHVGQISLQSNGGSQVITQAFHASSVKGSTAMPSAVRALDKAEVEKIFAKLLAAQPKKALRFTLYFSAGEVMLTDASVQLIPEIIKQAKAKYPAEIHIIAHTDAVGSKAENMRISSARARYVEAILSHRDSNIGSIYLSSHGENDPLIKTKDGVAEAKNRRVEIMIL